MIDKRLISFLILTLCMSIFDTAMKFTEVYSVNWDVFFFTSIYGFILYQIYLSVKIAKDPFKQSILYLLSALFIFRIVLNLFSFGRTYEEYSIIVNNEFIDSFTWICLILIGSLLLWQNLTRSRLY